MIDHLTARHENTMAILLLRQLGLCLPRRSQARTDLARVIRHLRFTAWVLQQPRNPS